MAEEEPPAPSYKDLIHKPDVVQDQFEGQFEGGTRRSHDNHNHNHANMNSNPNKTSRASMTDGTPCFRLVPR